jgi:hypothetical protein
MRIRLKGINSVKKTLGDGSVETYYYAWKGGPRLQGNPGSPEFIASYNEAVARKVVSPSGTLLSLLQQYQASPDFTDLADSTRRSYVALIKRIEKKFSDFPFTHRIECCREAWRATRESQDVGTAANVLAQVPFNWHHKILGSKGHIIP